jgi:O-antigen biosynthesis protein WbqV
MGDPVRIVDLARDLIRLSGLTPDEDIKIIFTGLRPGEKLHEELYQSHEDHEPTEHEKILRVTTQAPHPVALDQAMDRLYDLARAGRLADALALIAGLVPEYRPPQGIKPRSPDEIDPLTGEEEIIPLRARWY